MKLSEIQKIVNIEIIKEGTFNNIGMLSDQEKEKILVFIEDLSFVKDLENNPQISAIICNEKTVEKIKELGRDSLGIALSDNPKRDFFLLHNYLVEKTEFYGKKTKTQIDPTAKIHETAYVAEYNVFIGKNVVVQPHATILENVRIGDNSIIRANAVIGSEGFEYKRVDGTVIPVKHDGWVIVGERVEIDANTAVAKGVYGNSTIIGDDSKIDQLVHVAHNVKVGKRSLIIAIALLAGSCQIGDDAVVGPAAIIAPQVNVGNKAIVSLGSVVTKDVPEGQRVTGNFAIEHQKFIQFIKSIR